MKLKWLFVAGAFAASAQIAQARPLYQFDLDAVRHDMQVQVQPELSFVPATADVVMNVTFTNGGSEPVALTNWFIPGEDFDLPMFDVRRYGAPVEYMGPVIKRGVPTAADLVVLQPGESLSVPIDLSGSYDFSAGGDYTIRYSMRSAHLFGAGHAGVAVLRSPAAEISVESRAYFNPHDVLKAKPGTATCSATQQSTIGQALTAAAQMANDAQSYLAKTRPSATPRYTTWFGSFSQAGWDTAHGHFDKIADAFATKIHVADVDCGCKKSYYAYVYPTQPYKIYVCNAFWSAPMTGTDSKGGTLIHESSHFNVVASTDDWAYGQSAAKSLAISDPAKALDNADSHEYFAENTPAQQ